MFGRMYEDHGVELAAFPPVGRVLAIASAGDTAAALAHAGYRVTAVDINPVQLDYARDRLAGAPTVTGTAERLLAIGRAAAALMLPAWRPAELTRFLRMTEPSAQSRWWRCELDRLPLRVLTSAALLPAGPLAAAVLRSGLRDVIAPRFGATLRARIAAGVARYPNATNPWAWRLLLGRECPGVAGPVPVAGIEWIHADVAEHLRQVPAGWYDAATLSNVLDGPPPTYADRLREALRHAVRPGGPVILRTFRTRSPLAGRPLADRSLLWGTATQVEIGV
jgi:SAM-dependent methyltransferase